MSWITDAILMQKFAMAGAGKRRAKAEAAASSCGEPSSSGGKTSQSPGVQRNSPEHSSESRSSPQSVPRYDGNADPQRPGTTLEISSRNVMDSLGIAAFFASQGVSQTSLPHCPMSTLRCFAPRHPSPMSLCHAATCRCKLPSSRSLVTRYA